MNDLADQNEDNSYKNIVDKVINQPRIKENRGESSSYREKEKTFEGSQRKTRESVDSLRKYIE